MASTSNISDLHESIMIKQEDSWNEDSDHDVSGNATMEDAADDADIDIFESAEQLFYKILLLYEEKHNGSNRKPWTEERIAEVITALKHFRVSTKRKAADYYWMSKYDVVKTETDEYLIFKKKSFNDSAIRIVPREKYFEVLSEIHTLCAHGGRDKMLQELKNKYYIPKKAVEIFVSTCPICKKSAKKSGPKFENARRSIISRCHTDEKGLLDLIDLQFSPDGEYNWVLSYQNLTKRFVILRPLKTTNAVEVAYELLKIFFTLGAPEILQSNLASNFITSVLEELRVMWPDCKIIHEVQENIENITPELQTMLQSWMIKNNCNNWSVGCLFVQYYRNASSPRAVGKVPCEALFSPIPKLDTNWCSISASTASTSKTEEQLSSAPVQGNFNIKVEIDIENNSPEPDNTETKENSEQKVTPVAYESGPDNAYKCNSCSSTIHIIHGVTENEQGQSLKVLCYVCKNNQDMPLPNKKELKRTTQDTDDEIPKKIVKTSLEVGDSVQVAVPKAYRGPLNTITIKGKIVDFTNGVYRVGTQVGMIKNWFSPLDLQYTDQNYGDISRKPVSLEEAVASQTELEVSQTSTKCNCNAAVNQCHNFKCLCYKNNILCGPRCHKRTVGCTNS